MGKTDVIGQVPQIDNGDRDQGYEGRHIMQAWSRLGDGQTQLP